MTNMPVKTTCFLSVRFLFLTLIFLLGASCNLLPSKSTNAIPVKELNFPKAERYEALVRTNDDIFVLVNGGNLGDLQQYAKEEDQELLQFSFPDDPQCSTEKYFGYETLPSGKLQVWKWCLTEHGGVNSLMSYDWDNNRLKELAGPLPLGSSGASWNPDQTKAVAYLDGGFATRTLYWILTDSYNPLNLVIGERNRSWNLSDDFPSFEADDTGKTGTTGRAAWSPNGRSIAFFASPDAIGKTGFARFDVEYNLYLMDPVMLQPVATINSIYSPFLLSWSPDSNYIAFIGKRGFQRENGVWLYSIADGSTIWIAEGVFQGMVWRQDGLSLVAIQCESIDICNKVIEYDLKNLLQK